MGRGLAVALSRVAAVVLVGPPGSGQGVVPVRSTGTIRGEALVEHREPDSAPCCGLCFVAVKAYTISAIASAVLARAGAVVCLSNGMGLEEAWGEGARRVEPCVVLGGFTSGPGWNVATHPGGFVASRRGAAAGILGSAGLDIIETDDMETWRWAKWLLNSSLNPVAALAGAANDRIRPSGLEPLLRRIQSELCAVVPDGARQAARAEASRMTDFLLSESGNRCSMLQDLERGRPTEIEFLTGLAGRRLPGACPLAEAVTALVRARSGPAGAASG